MHEFNFWRWRFAPGATLGLACLMTLLLLAFYRPMLVAGWFGLPHGGEFVLPLAFGLLLLLGLLGLLRPDLLLCLAVFSIPLTYRSRGFWDGNYPFINDKFFPLHEILLWMSVLATLFSLVLTWPRQRPTFNLQTALLPLLWLAVGLLGVLLATPEGTPEAWREWRWMFVEPLMLYALVRFWARRVDLRWNLVAAVLLAGVGTAVVALLQRRGIDLTPLRGTGQCYSDFVVNTGGVTRTSSVFCHPNNLALWLGRIWPLALVLAVGLAGFQRPNWRSFKPLGGWRWWLLLCGAVALLTLASMVLTYSKGARFAGALVLIALSTLSRRWWFTVLTTLVLGSLLAYSSFNGPERLKLTGDSSFARLSLWRSASQMIADQPWGIGLDQFFFYYNPVYGRNYIEAEVREEEKTTAHPHNLVLDLWLRVGPWGLAVFSWIIWRTARRGWNVWRNTHPERWLALGILAALAVGLLHGLIDQAYFSTELAMLTWLLIGLVDVLWHQRLMVATNM